MRVTAAALAVNSNWVAWVTATQQNVSVLTAQEIE
jgi:hypothetical protein